MSETTPEEQAGNEDVTAAEDVTGTETDYPDQPDEQDNDEPVEDPAESDVPEGDTEGTATTKEHDAE